MNSHPEQKTRVLRWSVVFVLLLISAICFVGAVRKIVRKNPYAPITIPGTASTELAQAGTYTLFCAPPMNATLSTENWSPPRIDWAITGPDGQGLTLKPYSGRMTVNDTVAIGTLDVPVPGKCVFVSTVPEEPGSRYEISFRKDIARTVVSVILLFVGGFGSLGILGLYLLIALIRWLARPAASAGGPQVT